MRPTAERQALEGCESDFGPLGRDLTPGEEPTQHLQDLEVEQLGGMQPAGAPQLCLDGGGRVGS